MATPDPRMLDKFLPPMRCDRGCDRCCGVVACSKSEYDRIVAWAKEHAIDPVRQGTTCPWFQDGACAVYEVRPSVCRIFGHGEHPFLACPKGYNVNIPEPTVRRIMRPFLPDGFDDSRLLHEAVISRADAIAMLNLRGQIECGDDRPRYAVSVAGRPIPARMAELRDSGQIEQDADAREHPSNATVVPARSSSRGAARQHHSTA